MSGRRTPTCGRYRARARWTRGCQAALMCAASTSCAPASGTGSHASNALPVRYVMRPLTLPQGMLRVDVAAAAMPPPHGGGRPYFGLSAGAGYGITEDVEIHVVPAEVTAEPGWYGNPRAGARVRSLRGATQLVADVALGIPVAEDRFAEVYPSMTLAHRFGRWVRVDVGLGGAFFLAADGRHDVGFFGPGWSPLATASGLSIQGAVQTGDTFHIAVRSGLTAFSPEQRKRYVTTDGRMNIPLGLDFMKSFTGTRGPVAELGLRIDFPYFLNPGSDYAFGPIPAGGIVLRFYP